MGDGFAAVIGLKPRNFLVFLFFLVSALALLMVILVLVAYAGVRVDALRGLWTSAPVDGAKVVAGLLVFFLFLWFGMRAVGVSHGTSFILAVLLGVLIFLFVRIFGEEELGAAQATRSRRRIP